MADLAFLDIETTGLDPRVHVPWEVAIVLEDGTEIEWCWRPSDVALAFAEDEALAVGGFAERAPQIHVADAEGLAARAIAEALDGMVVVGSKPSFDVEMLTPWLRSWGMDPTWHHRPVCVATMAYGYLHGVRAGIEALDWQDPRVGDLAGTELPWRSDDLSRACGVDPAGFARHTALGDARWVRAWWEHICPARARETGGVS